MLSRQRGEEVKSALPPPLRPDDGLYDRAVRHRPRSKFSVALLALCFLERIGNPARDTSRESILNSNSYSAFQTCLGNTFLARDVG